MSGVLSDTALAWMVALPLLAAIAAFLAPRRAAAIGLLASLLLWLPFGSLVSQVSQLGVQLHAVGGWAAPLGIVLRADGLSLFLLAMVMIVGFAVSLYATGYLRSHGAGDGGARDRARFWVLWLVLWAALHALLLSRDLFNVYVTLELIGLSAVALVALAGAPVALAAAMRYLLVSLLGSLAFLLGVALLYAAHGTLDMSMLRGQVGGTTSTVALGLMTTGLLMKTALFPLHFWLPPAHANAPAPVSALLSALVVKASFYLLLRLWFDVFAGGVPAAALQAIGALGAAAVLWGSYQALRQPRLKLLVAYSTVAQVGYLFLLFPLAGPGGTGFAAWAGGLYFALSHACAKTVMFLAAGNLMHVAGHDRLSELGATARALPTTMFAFALAAVSIVGLPPSGGFIAKWMLLNAAIGSGQWWWVAVMAAGTLMAAAYVVRVLGLPFVPVPAAADAPRLPAPMAPVTLALALLVIVLGFAASPLLDWLRVAAPVGGPALVGGTP